MDAVNARPIRQIGFRCPEHGVVMTEPDDGRTHVPWICPRLISIEGRKCPLICGTPLTPQVQGELMVDVGELAPGCPVCGHAAHSHAERCLVGICDCRAGRPGDSQPMPVVNEAPSVQSQVIADIEKRIELGIARYGTALQPFNGRNMLKDLYEELLDACVYIKGVIIERDLSAAQGD